MEQIRTQYIEKTNAIDTHRVTEYTELKAKIREIEGERRAQKDSIDREYSNALEDFQFAPENRDIPVYELWKKNRSGCTIFKAYTLREGIAKGWAADSHSNEKWVVTKKLRNYDLDVIKGAATGRELFDKL